MRHSLSRSHEEPALSRDARRSERATATRMLTARPWCWDCRRCAGPPHGLAQRPGHGLELRLDDVVGVGARPDRTQHLTCRVIRAVWPNDSQMWRVRRGRVHRPDRTAAMPGGSSCTRYGRPDRSTATCTSASSSGTSALPNRRMPALSPSASANASPSAIAVSSTVWCASMCRSPIGVHGAGRTRRACRAGRACGRRSRRRSRRRPCPVPSRSISTLGPSTRAVSRSTRAGAAASPVIRATCADRGQERVGLLRRAGGDPQPAGQADVADQHAAVQQRLARPPRWSSNRPNSTKLASLSATGQPALAQRRPRSGPAAP